jgi:hypothetical protein
MRSENMRGTAINALSELLESDKKRSRGAATLDLTMPRTAVTSGLYDGAGCRSREEDSRWRHYC